MTHQEVVAYIQNYGTPLNSAKIVNNNTIRYTVGNTDKWLRISYILNAHQTYKGMTVQPINLDNIQGMRTTGCHRRFALNLMVGMGYATRNGNDYTIIQG
ncbi:MAG: hypothetical protein LBV80_09525 [Deltaproteobacteria bacterium]|jgi:hypothetical protein|nr:hypothetical protein [Deltaproteobacteria bacterium]